MEREPVRLGEALRVAVVVGVLVGVVFAAVTIYRRNVQHVFTWMSPDVIWLSPVGHVTLASVTALGLWVLGRLFRGLRWDVFLSILIAFAALSTIPHLRGLHPLATVLLSMGVGATAGAALARSRVLRLLRSWRACAAVSLIPIAGLVVSRHNGRLVADATDAGAPNVLLLILDTVRASSTSLHGYPRATTPTLEALAAAGVRYDFAIAPSAWTLSSHASMFTGQAATRLSASWRTPLDATYPVVAEVLRERGYLTAGFTANDFYTHQESGLARGFAAYSAYSKSWRELLWATTVFQTPMMQQLLWTRSADEAWEILTRFEFKLKSQPHHERRRAEEVVNEFLDWQGAETPARPWFAFLNLYDAHDPYQPPARYRSIFSAQPSGQDLYDGGIRYMDDEIARLVRVLRERGQLDNTLLIVTSDHGEQWGEHGLFNHGNSLFLSLVHVPLVIHWPRGIREPHRVTTPVSLRHMAATILDAASVPRRQIPGVSLLDDPGAAAPAVSETEQLDDRKGASMSPARRGDISSLVIDSLHYLRNADSTWQLFHIRDDYAERRNLVRTQAGCGKAVELDSVLRQLSPWPATPALSAAVCDSLGRAGRLRD